MVQNTYDLKIFLREVKVKKHLVCVYLCKTLYSLISMNLYCQLIYLHNHTHTIS